MTLPVIEQPRATPRPIQQESPVTPPPAEKKSGTGGQI
jgi:hypothetical protein